MHGVELDRPHSEQLRVQLSAAPALSQLQGAAEGAELLGVLHLSVGRCPWLIGECPCLIEKRPCLIGKRLWLIGKLLGVLNLWDEAAGEWGARQAPQLLAPRSVQW